VKPKSTRPSAFCPYCASLVRLSRQVEIGYPVICCKCKTPLKIVSLDPPELDYLWDDQWEYDYWTLENLYTPDADSPQAVDFGSNGQEGISGDGDQ